MTNIALNASCILLAMQNQGYSNKSTVAVTTEEAKRILKPLIKLQETRQCKGEKENHPSSESAVIV